MANEVLNQVSMYFEVVLRGKYGVRRDRAFGVPTELLSRFEPQSSSVRDLGKGPPRGQIPGSNLWHSSPMKIQCHLPSY